MPPCAVLTLTTCLFTGLKTLLAELRLIRLEAKSVSTYTASGTRNMKTKPAHTRRIKVKLRALRTVASSDMWELKHGNTLLDDRTSTGTRFSAPLRALVWGISKS